MRCLQPAALLAAYFTAVITDACAQQTLASCNPNVGGSAARIACLARIVDAQSKLIQSLENRIEEQGSAPFVTRAELDKLLSEYVKFKSAVAVNALVEPSLNQSDGRCLETYFDDMAVIAHKPCNFLSRKELRWQLLPASPDRRVEGR